MAANISLPCFNLTGIAVVTLLVKDCLDIQSPLEGPVEMMPFGSDYYYLHVFCSVCASLQRTSLTERCPLMTPFFPLVCWHHVLLFLDDDLAICGSFRSCARTLRPIQRQ